MCAPLICMYQVKHKYVSMWLNSIGILITLSLQSETFIYYAETPCETELSNWLCHSARKSITWFWYRINSIVYRITWVTTSNQHDNQHEIWTRTCMHSLLIYLHHTHSPSKQGRNSGKSDYHAEYIQLLLIIKLGLCPHAAVWWCLTSL